MWHLGDRSGWLVPRYGESCSPDEQQVARVAAGVCSPRALEVARTGSAFAYAQTKPDDEAKLRHMALAARHDLLGAPESDFWHPIRDMGWQLTHERSFDRAVEKGRALWHSLGAWPWSVCPPGPLPARWWLLPEVRSAFGAWSEIRGGRIRVRFHHGDGREVF